MILLIDADSLIFASCYRTKDEENEDPYYRDIEDSIAKFDEQFMKIVNDLEDQYEIDKVTTSHSTLLKRACSMIPSTLRVFNY